MVASLLKNRDYVIILARTAINHGTHTPRFGDRWQEAYDALVALIQQCQELDPDGITLFVSCDHTKETCPFKKHEQVKADQLSEILNDSYPPNAVHLQSVLQEALDDYFSRKEARKTKPNGEMILILLDGEPSDRMAVAKTIIEATHQIEYDAELGIGFVQVGDDLVARGFLNALDDHLQGAGAKFDIVNTHLVEQLASMPLTEALLQVLYD